MIRFILSSRLSGRFGACALSAVVLLLAAPGAALADAPVEAAVFPFELMDTSGETQSPAHDQRLAAATEQLRDLLDASGRYAVVDLAPVRDRLADLQPVRTCNGCELDLARAVGADVAVTGFVHKVSTLILSVHITVRDAETGTVLAHGDADIRGDNDRSWHRGVKWLVDHRILERKS